MTHLNDVELVDLLEGALAPMRAKHVLECSACSTRTEMLRDVLRQSSVADVPEPSPLFWDHFSSRVREGVRTADIGPAPSTMFAWLNYPAFKWSVSVALLALVLVGGTLWTTRPAVAPGLSTPEGIATLDDPRGARGQMELPAFDVLSDNDVAWALVQTAADEASWDDTLGAGLTVTPGSTDMAALMLTDAERAELVRLLQAESKRPGV